MPLWKGVCQAQSFYLKVLRWYILYKMPPLVDHNFQIRFSNTDIYFYMKSGHSYSNGSSLSKSLGTWLNAVDGQIDSLLSSVTKIKLEQFNESCDYPQNWLSQLNGKDDSVQINADRMPKKTSYLLLGMSYVDLNKTFFENKNRNVHPNADLNDFQLALDCVNKNIIGESDGRDLARCITLEIASQADIFTVSMISTTKEAKYREDRHMQNNYNLKFFADNICKRWPGVVFQEMILDYFYMPDVSIW